MVVDATATVTADAEADPTGNADEGAMTDGRTRAAEAEEITGAVIPATDTADAIHGTTTTMALTTADAKMSPATGLMMQAPTTPTSLDKSNDYDGRLLVAHTSFTLFVG